MRRLLLTILVFSASIMLPVFAQQGTVPDINYHPITPENIESLREMARWQMSQVTDVAWSSNHTTLAVAHPTGTVTLIRIFEDGSPAVYNTHADGSLGTAVSFSPDSRLLASASADSTVHILSPSHGDLEAILPHQSWVWSVAFHPEADIIATGSQDGTIQLWETDGNGPLRSFSAIHDGSVTGLYFDISNNRLISASLDKTARIWDLNTGEELLRMEGHEQGIAALAVHLEAGIIATAAGEGAVRLWDAETGELLHVMEGHAGGISAVTFNADGSLVASAGQDSLIRFWDTAIGELTYTLETHGLWVQGLTFNRAGTLLAAGDLGGNVSVWGISAEG